MKFDRLLESYIATAPRGLRSYLMAMPIWLGQKLWLADEIQRELAVEKGRAVRRSPRVARRVGLLPVAVRRGGGPDDRRRRRVDDVVDGSRHGPRLSMISRDAVPALGRAAVLGIHLFHRLQGQRGRVQADGPGAYGEPTYLTAIRDNLVDIQRGRQHRAEPRVLRVRPRPDDDRARFERLFGGPARPRVRRDAARDGSRPVGAGDHRRGDAADGDDRAPRDRHARTCAWPAAWRSTASATAACCAKGPSSDIWIQPAAGDAGGALGVAYALWHRYLGKPRVSAEAAGPGSRGSGSRRRGRFPVRRRDAGLAARPGLLG